MHFLELLPSLFTSCLSLLRVEDAVEFSLGGLQPLLASIGRDATAYDRFFSLPIFIKKNWVNLAFGIRVGLCLVGAALLILEVRMRRLGMPVAERWKRRIAIGMSLLAFGIYFDFSNPKARYGEYYHRHEFYHYYLGAKYNEELGYTRLYDCTLVAEIDNGRRASVAKREFRDLNVNLIRKVKDTYILTEPERCRDRFTPERWEDFRKDVDWFYRSSRGSYWERMQQDHGYNPPPVWTMTGKLFANIAPAGKVFFKILASIDVLLQAGMVSLLFWAFGWRVGMVATIFWGCNAAANFYWTGGAFLRMDWMFMLVASVALARKRYFFWAGFALMWSALLRVFPAALFGGWAAMVAMYTLREIFSRHKNSANEPRGFLSYIHPHHRRLIAGSFIAIATLVPASMLTTGGVHPYKEFVEHIAVHKHTPLTNHMGLPTILSHTWDGRMRFTRNNNLDDAFQEWKAGRNENKAKYKVLQYGIFGIFFLWIAWALRRTHLLWVAPALSLPLVMCLTDLTCYYYSMYIIAGVLVAVRRPIGAALLATGAASVILLGKSIGYASTNISGFYYVDDNFAAQSYLFLLFSALMLWSYSRPLSWAALRAWWQRAPEPRKKS
ncbi:MAG: hypothetical protein MK135_16950 [Polyangiaceae bacterium]|nr:hypothetical protein [Polyangiaceae bacterium]